MGDLARFQSETGNNTSAVSGDSDQADYSESNYDEFSGYGGEKLFTTNYEEDDVEADQIYNQVDEAMENRRRRAREQQLLLSQKRAKLGVGAGERPRIADQFIDLKRELATVTAEEWEAIPDVVADHTLKFKQGQNKKDSFMFTPVPDYLIAKPSSDAAPVSSVSASVGGTETSLGGMSSVFGGNQSIISGLAAEARGAALSTRLDKMSDSVSGQTVVDPKGYLTSLNSLKVNSEAEVGDIKKARILLQSVTTTNPKHGPGWIAAARVEEYASKTPQARKIILQGCEMCPDSEDVWLEAARLHPVEVAKSILANAVLHIPTSVKVWLQAAELEQQEARKKAVLRRSLEFVPNSVKLWKAAIELENVSDARIMLARAVECVPHSVEMWLALAKLETHENARKVLNLAREAIPTERATWITAAKLEEAHGNGHLVGRIVEKMIVSLAQYQVVIDREAWLKEAEECELAGAPLTCVAIVRNTVQLGVDPEDRLKTWMDDAEALLAHSPPAKETARAVYAYALEVFPSKRALWQMAAMLEKEFGTPASLESKLKEGVKFCPQAEVLWLMAAKEKWTVEGNVPAARSILLEAFTANPNSEQIWLAAVKLEWENNELVRARLLLQKAREAVKTERTFLKSALLERELEDYEQELRILDEAIAKFPAFAKLYMMAGQAADSGLGQFARARNYYLQGLKMCPNSVPLWGLLIRLEERVKGIVKARPTGELARMKLPANDLVWLECIRLERRAVSKGGSSGKLVESLVARALQECPHSGALWAEEVLSCPRQQQRSKCRDALKKCENDPVVLVAVARVCQKPAKARKWLSRAISLNAKFGDAWIHFYALEYLQLHGKALLVAPEAGEAKEEEDDEDELGDAYIEAGEAAPAAAAALAVPQQGDVLAALADQCAAAQPNKGELWCSVSKETQLRRKDVREVLKTAAGRVLGLTIE